MKVKTLTTLVAIAAAISTPAMAENFNYNYVQVGYSTGDVKGIGFKGDTSGVSLVASAALNETLFMTGGINNQDLKVGGLNANIDSYKLGIGARTSISNTTDLTASISYLSETTLELGAKTTGYGLDVGISHKVSDSIEFLAGVGYLRGGSQGLPKTGTTSVSIGGRYKINKNFSIGLGYSFATNKDVDGKGLLVATRYEF